jgi:hypothetical protein
MFFLYVASDFRTSADISLKPISNAILWRRASATISFRTISLVRPLPELSKQSRVVAMLQSLTGVSIAAMMKATGWQQHSVRGFLAGVVRIKLNLKLSSQKVDGYRLYRIVGRDGANSNSKRRTA